MLRRGTSPSFGGRRFDTGPRFGRRRRNPRHRETGHAETAKERTCFLAHARCATSSLALPATREVLYDQTPSCAPPGDLMAAGCARRLRRVGLPADERSVAGCLAAAQDGDPGFVDRPRLARR